MHTLTQTQAHMYTQTQAHTHTHTHTHTTLPAAPSLGFLVQLQRQQLYQAAAKNQLGGNSTTAHLRHKSALMNYEGRSRGRATTTESPLLNVSPRATPSPVVGRDLPTSKAVVQSMSLDGERIPVSRRLGAGLAAPTTVRFCGGGGDWEETHAYFIG